MEWTEVSVGVFILANLEVVVKIASLIKDTFCMSLMSSAVKFLTLILSVNRIIVLF